MTKLMFCGECGDLVPPEPHAMVPKWCRCGRHAVWWRDPQKGLISVHDKWMPERNGGDGGKGWVIGIANNILTFPGVSQRTNYPLDNLSEEDKALPDFQPKHNWKYGTFYGNTVTRPQWVKKMLELMEDTYIFKEAGSLIIRIAPGCSGDSRWDAIVPEHPKAIVRKRLMMRAIDSAQRLEDLSKAEAERGNTSLAEQLHEAHVLLSCYRSALYNEDI
jgi:hypothetical protein